MKPRSIVKSAVFNLVGQGIPLVIAFFAIPRLINEIGTEGFGVLALAWGLVGYFSLFDFGLGKALTKLVAEKLARKEEADLPSLCWSTLWITLLLGVVGAIALWTTADWITRAVLKISPEFQDEALGAVKILAITLPLVITNAAQRGVLEAHHRFDITSILNVAMGTITFLGPLAALSFSRRLEWMVAVLAFGRVAIFLSYGLINARLFDLWPAKQIERRWLPLLFSFGGWMTVTNILGPLIVYLDRFVIGSMIGMAAVTYYVTPYEAVTKLWVIPMALINILFPIFSASIAVNKARAVELFDKSIDVIGYVLTPFVLIIVLYAHDILTFWVGATFADKSSHILQLLATGVLLNSISRVPFIMIQGGGRPDLVAKWIFLQFPFYIISLWLALNHFGIIGAAFIWTFRVFVDSIGLFILADKILAEKSAKKLKGILWILTLTLLSSVAFYIQAWGKIAMVSIAAALGMKAIIKVLSTRILKTDHVSLRL